MSDGANLLTCVAQPKILLNDVFNHFRFMRHIPQLMEMTSYRVFLFFVFFIR
ncbi:Uncharacterised protein [Vibrio cholerae]|nr:Uncharacterised protein [Vibrio cholerae]